VKEIEEIISAVNHAYREFVKAAPAKEVRIAVSRVCTFLVADLTSIDWSVTNVPERWQEKVSIR
jgi:hypothetical protein